MIDRIVKFVWRKRLENAEYKVVKVRGWRTFLVENKWGRRETITFMIQINKSNM